MTELNGRFYMAYTAYSRKGLHAPVGVPPLGITPMYAVSDNLITWDTLGPLVEDEDNKDHALFPAKIGGKFVTFHRRPPSIWLAFSGDVKTWSGHKEILKPRPGLWDGKRVGAGGPPIDTEGRVAGALPRLQRLPHLLHGRGATRQGRPQQGP